MVNFGHDNSSVIDLFHLSSNNDDKKYIISLHLPTLFTGNKLVRECLEVIIISKVKKMTALSISINKLCKY